MSSRTDFPLFPADHVRAAGDAPILLDGMEVLFDKKVGLAPVTLERTSKTPAVPGDDGRAG